MTHMTELQASSIRCTNPLAMLSCRISVTCTRALRNPHGSTHIIQPTPVCYASLLLHLLSFCHKAAWALPPPGSDVSGWHLSPTACHDSVQKNTHTNTYDVIAFGLEGIGAAGVKVRVVVALQEANVVEALSLRREEREKGIIGVGFSSNSKAAIGVTLSFVKAKMFSPPVPPTQI